MPDRPRTLTIVADPHVNYEQAAEAYRLHREGLSQRAIAEALGCAQSTVNSHIRRGRAALEAIALHDIAEQRNDSSGLLVEMRDRLWALWDDAKSVPEVTKLSREIRSVEAQRARLLGLDMPQRLAIEQDRPSVEPQEFIQRMIGLDPEEAFRAPE
jgi:predicted transcriptional regulator